VCTLWALQRCAEVTDSEADGWHGCTDLLVANQFARAHLPPLKIRAHHAFWAVAPTVAAAPPGTSPHPAPQQVLSRRSHSSPKPCLQGCIAH
jgi:hypothetical protein